MSGDRPLRFAIVAGEMSGDILGAALIRALRARFPDAQFQGVTGSRMRSAGCETVAGIDQLSVMGLAEVVKHLPRLLKLRRALFSRFARERPDCVIGIDAPDFNLPLERRLRARGIHTVHMVSPSVWAWRQSRVGTIEKSVDLMLCLLPFEPAFYATHKVPAEYIGHPLAEELQRPIGRDIARLHFGIAADAPCVAVLPGSRAGELKYLAAPFAATGEWLSRRVEGLTLVVPIARPELWPVFEKAIAEHAPTARWRLVDGKSREVMRAADAVLLASGTATLECLILDRPMVVGYRVSPLSAWLVRRMLKVPNVSLPNLLCEQALVPEYLQEQATPEYLGPALLELLQTPQASQTQLSQFAAVRQALKCGAADRAAAAIAVLLGK